MYTSPRKVIDIYGHQSNKVVIKCDQTGKGIVMYRFLYMLTLVRTMEI